MKLMVPAYLAVVSADVTDGTKRLFSIGLDQPRRREALRKLSIAKTSLLGAVDLLRVLATISP
jgi:hypothetical protein